MAAKVKKAAVAEEQAPVQDEPVQEEQPIEETPQPDSAESQAPEQETPESDAAEGDESVESAEDLRAKLEALQAENESLKAKQEPAEAQPQAQTQQQQKPSYARYFLDSVKPASEKAFSEINTVKVKDDGTVMVDGEAQRKQFGIISDMTDKMIGAVLADHVTPNIEQLALNNITLKNELELVNLKMADPAVKTKEAAIRKELQGLSWQDRNKPGVVESIYDRVTGQSYRKNGSFQPQARKGLPGAASALRDLSAGGTTVSRKPMPVKLTPSQESDYRSMSENIPGFTREKYAAKVKARNESRKQKNLKPVETLREQ